MGIRQGGLALAVITLALALTPSPAGARDDGVVYQPPVDAPVVDPFRAPASRFGAGNRGLTYDLAPSTPVRAAAPGQVVFAGPVAGTQHVTIRHLDGLRTSYSFLESIAVRRGALVEAGDVVGTGGAGFHFGVRDGDVYLDPATLFGRVEVRVRLVPHDEPSPPMDEGLLRERIALTEVVREQGLLRRAVDWGVDQAEQLVERQLAMLHTAAALDPVTALADAAAAYVDSSGRACTESRTATPAQPARGHVAVLVAGYGSSSERAAADEIATEELGYASADVLRYSYTGGRVPDAPTAGPLAAIPARPYGPEDTFADLQRRGTELADLAETAAELRPGAPIDLLAHSQGGIVVRLALAELERRGRLGVIGTVVTVGTPHRGDDLATGAALFGPLEAHLLEPIAAVTDGGVEPGATSVRQMGETSEVILRLRSDGVPAGVDLRTIGAAGDLVVSGDKTTVDGVPAAMVSLFGTDAHDRLPSDPATTREIALALAGLPPGCRSVAERFSDVVAPRAVSHAITALTAVAAAAAPAP